MIKKWWFLSLGVSVLSVSLLAQNLEEEAPFRVREISETFAGGWVLVDNGWINQCKIIRLELAAKNPPASGSQWSLEAYIFDREGKLLRRYNQLPRMVTIAPEYQKWPDFKGPNRNAFVGIPLAPAIQKSPTEWKSVVVKLTCNGATVTAVYPRSRKLEEFNLDQQTDAIVETKSAEPAPADGGPGLSDAQPVETASKGKFKVSRVSRLDTVTETDTNSGWARTVGLIEATLTVVEAPRNPKLFAHAYFYDQDKKLIKTYKEPPRTAMGGVYVTLPVQFNVSENYTVYFPVMADMEKSGHRWKTVIVVFGNAESAVAVSRPALESLDEYEFPEKSNLQVEEKKDNPF